MQAIPKKCKMSALLHSWVFFIKNMMINYVRKINNINETNITN